MSEKTNPAFAFEDNELDILEHDRRQDEPTTNQAIDERRSRRSWKANGNVINAYLSKHRRVFKAFSLTIFNVCVLAYIIYAGVYWKRQFCKGDCDFQWCNGYGMLLIIAGLTYVGLFYSLIVKRYFRKHVARCCRPVRNSLERLQNTRYGARIGAATFYLLVLIAVVIFLIIDTADSRYRLISLLGVVVTLGLGWIFSKHPGRINWRPVICGLILQFVFGLVTLRWPVGRSIFECLSHKVSAFLGFAKAGASFVFSKSIVDNKVFAFSVLPVIFFFSFTVQILSYIGALQWIIMKLGGILQSILSTTLCESISAVANPFLGMTESPLLIKPYLNKLTLSELHAILSSGFATVSGTVFVAYLAFGAQPIHLITASIMAAPAALCYSKLFYPETEQSLTKLGNIKLEKSSDTSIMDAATNGALAALPIILGIIANIVAFISFITFVNAMLSWFGDLVGYEALSLELILAKIFMPVSWIMGVPWEHCEDVGTLIGLKTVINELIAYQKMGEFKKQGRISGRSETIATFAICGFANPGSIGIQLGCLSSLAPESKEKIASVILRAFVAGSAVSFLTASIAGVLTDDVPLVSNVTDATPNITAAVLFTN